MKMIKTWDYFVTLFVRFICSLNLNKKNKKFKKKEEKFKYGGVSICHFWNVFISYKFVLSQIGLNFSFFFIVRGCRLRLPRIAT